MHFDAFTALSVSFAVTFVLGIVLLFFWMHSPRSRWFAYWSAGFFAVAVSIGLIIVSPTEPRPLGFALGTAPFILGFMLFWQATRVFDGRPTRWAVPAFFVFAWPLLFLVPEIRTVALLRVLFMSVPLGGALALAAWETWRGRAENLPSRRPLAVVLAAMAATLFGRVPFGPLATLPLGASPTSDLTIAALIGGLILAIVLVATLVIATSLERQEMGQRQLAKTDALTGLLNRRGLDAAFPDGRLPVGAALVVFDLDRFKLVNDSFGHAAGDALIAAFALICREELRQVDVAVRLGGEEFALVLPRTGQAAALAVAERVRSRYAATVVPIVNGAVAGTASGGIYCASPGAPVRLDFAIAAADQAMYRAKSEGRNRIRAGGLPPAATSGVGDVWPDAQRRLAAR